MLATHRPWTKKELLTRLKDLTAKGEKLPGERVLLETSMFGPEIRPNTKATVCLDHPKRTKFATVSLDADCNIVGVR